MTATEPTPRDRLTAVEPLDRTAQVQVSHKIEKVDELRRLMWG